MVNIKHKIIFLLVFLSFGCASVDDVESKSLIERGLEELSNFNGQNQDINEKRVDGLPLIIVLSLNGINEAYIREYESKGGGYNFPDYFLNALCVEDKFDDALYFIHDKKMEISPLSFNGNRASCLKTALNKLNFEAFKKFLLVAKSKSDAEEIDKYIFQLLEERIQILEGFLNE